MARITVFGLNMDQTTYDRIVAAVRYVYPDLTAGLTDPMAIQTVLKSWTADIVASAERAQAGPDPSIAALEAAAAASETQQTAEETARSEIGTDVQPTGP
jgi:hypothetical protein